MNGQACPSTNYIIPGSTHHYVPSGYSSYGKSFSTHQYNAHSRPSINSHEWVSDSYSEDPQSAQSLQTPVTVPSQDALYNYPNWNSVSSKGRMVFSPLDVGSVTSSYMPQMPQKAYLDTSHIGYNAHGIPLTHPSVKTALSGSTEVASPLSMTSLNAHLPERQLPVPNASINRSQSFPMMSEDSMRRMSYANAPTAQSSVSLTTCAIGAPSLYSTKQLNYSTGLDNYTYANADTVVVASEADGTRPTTSLSLPDSTTYQPTVTCESETTSPISNSSSNTLPSTNTSQAPEGMSSLDPCIS
jgi:hypothetical protein